MVAPPFSDPVDDDEPLLCRICHDDTGPMISPCACSGSMRHVHQSCLLEWLQHAHGASLSNAIECRVCKQPFKLHVPGLRHYVMQGLRSLSTGRAGIGAAIAADVEHLLGGYCDHVHCTWLRLALVGCVLQLCIWQGQVLMLVAFALIRMVLRFDAVLDELVIPATMLNSFCKPPPLAAAAAAAATAATAAPTPAAAAAAMHAGAIALRRSHAAAALLSHSQRWPRARCRRLCHCSHPPPSRTPLQTC